MKAQRIEQRLGRFREWAVSVGLGSVTHSTLGDLRSALAGAVADPAITYQRTASDVAEARRATRFLVGLRSSDQGLTICLSTRTRMLTSSWSLVLTARILSQRAGASPTS